uniref:Uncharacterized protein n=1 Tax=Rhizophora mucronata TaxID=61149 RepID=A0A2P2L0J8_RHIMU
MRTPRSESQKEVKNRKTRKWNEKWRSGQETRKGI